MIKPYAFGCKRVALENGFYENFERPNVHLVDVIETPVQEVTPAGIRTSEKEWEFDCIISATGFDAVSGGLLNMNIVGKGDVRLEDAWKDGILTYLGMSVPGFPNM